MKKIFLLLLYILGYSLYNGQEQGENIGITRPTPSVASLSTYSTIPVSIQTGIPEISYPLINLETASKSVNISLGINYHAGNAGSKSIGEVGRGWSLLGAGVISREIFKEFDEVFDNSNFSTYIKNKFNDIYNFNIPGESGKFRFVRDSINDSFTIGKLTPYTSKIEYHRSSNQATLILDSLTITSDTGIKYVFKDYDISLMRVRTWSSSEQGTRFTDAKYRSAFYLSSILDENEQELVKYTYLRDLKYTPGTNNLIIDTETNKLSRIEVKGRGIVEFNYDKNELYSKNNDIFAINNIVLKTKENVFVKKYIFEYSYPSSQDLLENYRVLNSFSQIDKDGKVIEKYAFNYREIFHFENNKEGDVISVLNKVDLPTGGAIVYNFDMQPLYYSEKKTIVPVPKEVLADLSFDKVNGDRKYAFTITDTKTVDIDATGIGRLASYLWAVQFWKKEGNSYVGSHSMGVTVDPNPDFPFVQSRTFEPGEYYVDLYCNEHACQNLTFRRPAVIKVMRDGDGDPTEKVEFLPSMEGLPRIKDIKFFDAIATGINMNSLPSKIEEYDYNKFDNPEKSSAYFVEGGILNEKPANPSHIYKNVKVSNGTNTGYTKYYFKAPDAYPFDKSTKIWTNFNLTRGGLMEKKEVYNAANQKQAEDLFDYTFEEYDSPKYLVVPSTSFGNFYLKTAWVKNEKVTSKNFFASGFAETKKEMTRNNTNYKTQLERVTSFDGNIQETTYQYALDKNNQKLIAANIIGIPLETTSIIKKNVSDAGKLMSRAETKYDNPANKLPSSAVSYDTQNNLAEEVTFNRYDSKGNLEQYTTKEGIPVSVVWGYSKTQPIAKIEGATYDQVSVYIADIISKSDADVDVASEQSFQNALDLFRNNSNLGNYQITTYVYDPLIGMKSMTPPSGIREMYQYDKAGRLDQIVDEKGKVLKKYKYNYKQ